MATARLRLNLPFRVYLASGPQQPPFTRRGPRDFLQCCAVTKWTPNSKATLGFLHGSVRLHPLTKSRECGLFSQVRFSWRGKLVWLHSSTRASQCRS